MSKKRKTRRQKEIAHLRHQHEIEHVRIESPAYSITTSDKKTQVKPISVSHSKQYTEDFKYLKKDILNIGAATGIIFALNILLFVLLSTGVVKLNFLGY